MNWLETLTWANPAGLLGLLSLPVILALHALRLRSRKAMISSLPMWAFLEKEVSGSRFGRIPLTWILLLHLLAASLFSLALAGPQLDLKAITRSARHVIVILDVSYSMQANDIRPTRLEQAGRSAGLLLTELGPDDVGSLIVFGAGGEQGIQWAADSRWFSGNEGPLKWLDILNAQVGTSGLMTAPGGSPAQALFAALALAENILAPGLPARVVIFTDGAYELPTDGKNLALPGGSIQPEWVLLGAQSPDNLAVVEISAAYTTSGVQLFTRLANFSSTAKNTTLTLLLNQVPIDSRLINLAANGITPYTWDIPTALLEAEGPAETLGVSLLAVDHLPEDNKASVNVQNQFAAQVRVALVSENPAGLGQALQTVASALGNIQVDGFSPEAYTPNIQAGLFVFEGFIPESWPAGRVVVFEPPAFGNFQPGPLQTISLGTSIPAGTPGEAAFANINFSGLRSLSFPALAAPPPGYRAVFQTEAHILALRGREGLADVLLFLPQLHTEEGLTHPLLGHPAFPAFLANLFEQTFSSGLPLAVPAGSPIPLDSIRGSLELIITPPQASPQRIPPTLAGGQVDAGLPGVYRETHEAGLYKLEYTGLDGVKHTHWVAVNAGDLEESNILPRDWAANLPGPGDVPPAAPEGKEAALTNLAPWLLALAALLLIGEAWLAWR